MPLILLSGVRLASQTTNSIRFVWYNVTNHCTWHTKNKSMETPTFCNYRYLPYVNSVQMALSRIVFVYKYSNWNLMITIGQRHTSNVGLVLLFFSLFLYALVIGRSPTDDGVVYNTYRTLYILYLCRRSLTYNGIFFVHIFSWKVNRIIRKPTRPAWM